MQAFYLITFFESNAFWINTQVEKNRSTTLRPKALEVTSNPHNKKNDKFTQKIRLYKNLINFLKESISMPKDNNLVADGHTSRNFSGGRCIKYMLRGCNGKTARLLTRKFPSNFNIMLINFFPFT